jgi:hypothetical protein
MFSLFRKNLSDEQKGLVGWEIAILLRKWEEDGREPITTEITHGLVRAALRHKKLPIRDKDVSEIGMLALSIPKKVADDMRLEIKK